MRRRRIFWAGALLLALAASVAASACSGGGDDDASGDRATSTTVDEEAAVLAAYEAGWRAFDEASADPVNPDHPGLAGTMTGPALEAARNALGQMAELQEYLAGPGVVLSPHVRELSGDRAVIEDCVTDESVRYAADGTVVSPAEPTPHAYEAVMVKEGGVWKRQELNLGNPCES